MRLKAGWSLLTCADSGLTLTHIVFLLLIKVSALGGTAVRFRVSKGRDREGAQSQCLGSSEKLTIALAKLFAAVSPRPGCWPSFLACPILQAASEKKAKFCRVRAGRPLRSTSPDSSADRIRKDLWVNEECWNDSRSRSLGPEHPWLPVPRRTQKRDRHLKGQNLVLSHFSIPGFSSVTSLIANPSDKYFVNKFLCGDL